MTNTETSSAAVVRIGKGLELHLALSATYRHTAYCKGLRSHRAFKVSSDLCDITCLKCKSKAIALGLIKSK